MQAAAQPRLFCKNSWLEYNGCMENMESYQPWQVGTAQLLLDVLIKINGHFNLGKVGIGGCDLNIEADTQLKTAKITLHNLEPEVIHLNFYEKSGVGRPIQFVIADLERDISNALNKLITRNDSIGCASS